MYFIFDSLNTLLAPRKEVFSVLFQHCPCLIESDLFISKVNNQVTRLEVTYIFLNTAATHMNVCFLSEVN